tara:strand:- start:591 stop:2453 length:1863 start_codon:yes stop_codon:yes gene_type:complete
VLFNDFYKYNKKMHKTKFIIFFFFFSISLSSQELDENFLDSLPDDIRKDVLERADEQDKSTDENYRPYQYSSKLQQAEELISLKKRLETDLEELEKRLSSDDSLRLGEDLKLFGSNFFNTFQTSFMPINEPNPEPSYVLDVGDVLKIQLVGQMDFINNFPIGGDGSINLEDIGKVVVAGLSLSEASDLIKSKVNNAMFGTEAFISLSSIRDVNILVTGNAKNPGIYTLTGNSNILQALSVAGGVSEYGSYREINLIRKNEVIETLDVYDLLIDGNYNLKKRLRSGDVVFVESRKNVVSIDGAVKRPAKYEITDNQFLNDVLRYANGLKQSADIQNISLERLLDGTMKSIPIANKKQFDDISPSDGDMIYIREFPFREAKIFGAVKKPGTYVMASGDTLADLIEKAGGYNVNAYPFGAVYLNDNAKEINKRSQEILYKEFLDNIIAISQRNISQNLDLMPIVSLTEEIKDADPVGRIVVDLIDENSSDLILVSEGDELFIPEMNNNVYVYGEISVEGAVMFSPNQSVEFFVEKSGGYKQFADTESIYILHPNGESQSYTKKRNIFEASPLSSSEIYPGSIIFVPRKLDESSSRRLAAQAYVSILGNLGIALASLSSINNNN